MLHNKGEVETYFFLKDENSLLKLLQAIKLLEQLNQFLVNEVWSLGHEGDR